VIASSEALAGITADIDKDVFLADNPEEFAASIYRAAMTTAGPAIGRNARNRVMMDYRWSASLARLDVVLNG
jgi:hypothetical protein